jgi:dihydrofolate reductase
MTMRPLTVFNHVSLDGYFSGAGGDIAWFKAAIDPEFQEFSSGSAGGADIMLFGRVTYQMMASYWPTPAAQQQNPVVAEAMNRTPKIVFSRTLTHAEWTNTRILNDKIEAEIRRLKAEPGKGLVLLGSGSIIAQLAPHGLIDSYGFMVNPVALGKGKTMFDGIGAQLTLKHVSTRTFKNGNVLLNYAP